MARTIADIKAADARTTAKIEARTAALAKKHIRAEFGVVPGARASVKTAKVLREASTATTSSLVEKRYGRGRPAHYEKNTKITLFLGRAVKRFDKNLGEYVSSGTARVLSNLNLNAKDFKADLYAFAEDGANQMINIISASKKQGRGNSGGLEKAIKIYDTVHKNNDFLITVGFNTFTKYSSKERDAKDPTTKWVGYGIGRKSDLPKYWAAVNYGSSHLLKFFKNSDKSGIPLGHFYPGTRRPISGGGGNVWRFSQAKGYSFTFIPKTPIKAMNYVGRTYDYMKTSPLASVLGIVKRKIRTLAKAS